jgi:hypothetical protein
MGDFQDFEFLPEHDFVNDDYFRRLAAALEDDAVTYCKALAKVGGDHKAAYALLKPGKGKKTASNRAPELRRQHMGTREAKQLVGYLRGLMATYDEHQAVTLEEIVRQAERDFRDPTTDAKTRAMLAEKIVKWRGLHNDAIDKSSDLEDADIIATLESIARETKGLRGN